MKERILVVNDRQIPRYVAEESLRREGYEIVSAATGAATLAAVRDDIDLVVLDVQLPDLDGFEVCRRIKQDPATTNIVVLLTSATFVTTKSKVTGLDSGADGYLVQPYEAAELHATVRALLRTRSAERRTHALAEELRAAMEVRDEFLAMLGHELRNPLNTIGTALHMMEQRPEPENTKRYLEILGRQQRSLARIVDDLLDVARITRGKVTLDRTRLDLREIAERCVQSLDDEVRASKHTIRLDVPDIPVPVLGDVVRLDQIVCNLITNANKYTPAGGHIDVRVSIVDGRARVEISDNGIGMDDATLANVFEVFVQANQTLDRARGGLGLGLTVVRKLAEMHGGSVRAFSDGKDRGSRFVVELPLIAELPREVGADDAEPHRKGMRVLVIEDNDDARWMLQEALSDLDHHVEVAADGEAGLELALASTHDVVLVDIGLPKLDGYEVARQIRARCNGDTPHLVAMTGYGQPEDRQQALRAGFDVHLVKPIAVGDLRKILDERGR